MLNTQALVYSATSGLNGLKRADVLWESSKLRWRHFVTPVAGLHHGFGQGLKKMSVTIRDPCIFAQRVFATRDWHHLATPDVILLDMYVAFGRSLEEITVVYQGHFSNSGQAIGLGLIMDPPIAFEKKNGEESWMHAVELEV